MAQVHRSRTPGVILVRSVAFRHRRFRFDARDDRAPFARDARYVRRTWAHGESHSTLVHCGRSQRRLAPSSFTRERAMARDRERHRGPLDLARTRCVRLAIGIRTTFDDPARLHALVSALTDQHERPRDEPWRVTDAPETSIDGQLRGIVGIEIALARMIGKWKISQNRSKADRAGAT